MSFLSTVETTFLFYFIVTNGFYLLLSLTAFFAIYRYMSGSYFDHLPDEFNELLPPVTVIIPAYNEEDTIVHTVRSVLKETYPGLRIVVVNDGSEDKTLDRLDEAFDLEPTTDVIRIAVPCSNLREVYKSRTNEAIRVIDKEKNPKVLKGDALNAGLNLADTPLVCCIDADSILEEGCLNTLARPFLKDPETVAAGGTIRVANGSTIDNSTLREVSLSWNPLELFQVVEYLRAFLFGRMGWVPFNALPVISGALAMFDRKTLIDLGGFKNDSVSEDMEIILRMHRKLGPRNESYKINYVPDPICWTQVPADVNSLRSQRISWQQGLSESIFSNLGLLGEIRSPGAGLMSFPYLIIVEWFGALVEVAGYTFMGVGILTGYLSPFTTVAFFLVAIGLGIFHSVFTLLLEVISFRVYSRISHLIKLFGAAVLENFGYRQVNSLWRTYGVFRHLLNKKGYPGKKKQKPFNPED